jgi:hypothetical protein
LSLACIIQKFWRLRKILEVFHAIVAGYASKQSWSSE